MVITPTRRHLLSSFVAFTLLATFTLFHWIRPFNIDFLSTKDINPDMATSLKHLKVAPKEAHTASVIFLHVLDLHIFTVIC